MGRWMAEFVQNPRRAPRAPARCLTSVVSAQGTFEATTEDVGGHGCQLVSPRLVRKGEPVQLVVAHEAVKQPLRVAGRIAWSSERPPWRLGIAYDEASHPQTEAWFEELLARVPGLGTFRRIPEKIPIDATVYLAAPPRFVVDLTPDEVSVLRALGSGTSVAELRALLRDRWQPVQRALFSLLAHQHVTLTRGSSVHPDAWRRILTEVEASLAVESLRNPAVPELTPSPTILQTAPAPHGPAAARPAAPAAAAPPQMAPSWSPAAPAAPAAPAPFAMAPAWRPPPATGAPDPAAAAASADEEPASWLVPAVEMMPASWPTPTPPLPPAAPAPPRGANRGLDEGAAWGAPAVPPPLTGGAPWVPPAAPAQPAGGAPWSPPSAPAPPAGGAPPPPAAARSAEAQGCYERALAELEAGRVMGATALLRRALALSPGDSEIQGALRRVTERRKG
jgi:hypothetical protein